MSPIRANLTRSLIAIRRGPVLKRIRAMAKSAKKKLAKSTSKTKPVAKKAPKAKLKAKVKPVAPKKALAKKPVKPTKEAKPAKAQTDPKKVSGKSPVPEKKQVVLGPLVPGRLGEKRHCLKCATKFYDFERTPITCPKCFSEFEAEDFEPKIVLKSDSKKARQVQKEEETERELVVSDSGEDFESLEDLNDDDSAVVGIGPDKDTDESFD